MNSYTYQKTLKELWEKAVKTYADGVRGAENFFTKEELSFLKSIGHTAQEVYDFAEDYNSAQEPDFETFLTLADKRRNYFLHKQNGSHSDHIVESGNLPGKEESAAGIKWLPRIIPKAKAKLRGEMNPDLMYSCAGDRKFFKTHDIHPAEFLDLVEKNEDNDKNIIEYFSNRKKTIQTSR